MRKSASIVVISALALGFVTLGSSPAALAADKPFDLEEALWYYNDYGVDEVHAAGITGKGVTIAVLDGAIYADNPLFDGADIEVQPALCSVLSSDIDEEKQPATSDSWDAANHGTGMTTLIVGNGKGGKGAPVKGVAPDAKILYFPANHVFYGTQIDCNRPGIDPNDALADAMAASIESALDQGASIISISYNTGTPTQRLINVVARANREGAVIFAGRPNETTVEVDWKSSIDAMNGVVTVQAMARDGSIQAASAVSDPAIDVVSPGVDVLGDDVDWTGSRYTSGTSPATPITAAYFALAKQKWPDATAAQLVQLMIRTTGRELHEPKKDSNNFIGYGAVSLRGMIDNDPSQLPDDLSPLIVDTAPDLLPEGVLFEPIRMRPTEQEIYEPDATVRVDSELVAPEVAAEAPPLEGVGIALLALLLAGVLALLAVLVVQLRRRPQPIADAAAHNSLDQQ